MKHYFLISVCCALVIVACGKTVRTYKVASINSGNANLETSEGPLPKLACPIKEGIQVGDTVTVDFMGDIPNCTTMRK